MAVNDPSTTSGSRLDARAAVEGALLTLAIAVPPLWIVLILKSGDAPGEESNLWLLAPLALLSGFAVGGFRTATRRRETPLMHAAAAGAMAFAVILVISMVRRAVGDEELSVVHLIRLLLLAQICISVGLLGAYVGMRRATRRATR